jgi:hypothetical protein
MLKCDDHFQNKDLQRAIMADLKGMAMAVAQAAAWALA